MSAGPSVAIGRGPIAARLSAAGLDRGSIRHAVRSGRLTVVVLFLPPALLLFTLFVVIPVMEAGWYSAFNWNGYGRPTNWVGWQNYVAVVQTRAFALALRNNGLIILVSLLIQLPWPSRSRYCWRNGSGAPSRCACCSSCPTSWPRSPPD